MPSWVTRENIFLIISLGMAATFGWGFFSVAGFPPVEVGESWQLLLIFIGFLIIPFAKKLDFFEFISFEAKMAEVRREVGETKEKVADVREDVRHVIAQQNALSASVQTMTHQAVTVNNYDRPPQEQVEAATAEVAGVEPIAVQGEEPSADGLSPDERLLRAIFGHHFGAGPIDVDQNVKLADLFSNIEDLEVVRKINLSERVAILRIRIERELKRLLKPHQKQISSGSRIERGLTLSARELSNWTIKLHPELNEQRDSFDVFFRIASGAIHADDVPMKDLNIAIYLGERLLGLLVKIETHSDSGPEFST